MGALVEHQPTKSNQFYNSLGHKTTKLNHENVENNSPINPRKVEGKNNDLSSADEELSIDKLMRLDQDFGSIERFYDMFQRIKYEGRKC